MLQNGFQDNYSVMNLNAKACNKSGQPTRRKILFVLNPTIGRNSCWVRAQLFKDIFEKNDWETHYCTWTPEPLRHFSFNINKKNSLIIRAAKDCDIVYLIKVQSLRFVRQIQLTSRAKVVFDLNDALWNDNHNGGWRDLNCILRKADAVFAENDYLGKYAKALNKFVRIVPDSIPLGRFDAMRSAQRIKSEDKIVIGWVGSPNTSGAIRAIQATLELLFERHKNIELQILGCSDMSLLPPFKHVRCVVFPDGYDEETLVRWLLNIDIGLFPPPFDIKEYCARGVLKAVLYMAAEVPCVCQRAGDAGRLIQDEVTGMLAETPQEWFYKLEMLIESPQLRSSIGRDSLDQVRKQRSLDLVFARFETVLLELMDAGRRSRFARIQIGMHVLVINVRLLFYTLIHVGVRGCRSLFKVPKKQ